MIIINTAKKLTTMEKLPYHRDKLMKGNEKFCANETSHTTHDDRTNLVMQPKYNTNT